MGRLPSQPESSTIDDRVSCEVSFNRRFEVLRHVFPQPSIIRKNPGVSPRVGKAYHRGLRALSSSPSKPRQALHKIITSLFSPTRTSPATDIPNRSASSGPRCGTNSRSLYSSVTSLEFLSPGTFIFSGPNPRSQPDSRTISVSRLQNLTDNSTNNSPRARSSTFSINSMSLFEFDILEPTIERGIIRTVSKTIPRIGALVNEPLETSSLEDVAEDAQSLVDGENAEAPALSIPTNGALHRGTGHVASTASVSHRVPNEILQHIYRYLPPKDFNAARHTCRVWLKASLEIRLLCEMLTRGGWANSAKADLDKKRKIDANRLNSQTISDEWFLSRRLARECSLSADWVGNGLITDRGSDAIVQVAITDFTELTKRQATPSLQQGDGIMYAASVCKQFLLVSSRNTIYVYELRNGMIVPRTYVVCPRRVLAMSMDTSASRHAIAALLEGQLGMVCELQYGCQPSPKTPVVVPELDSVHVRSDERSVSLEVHEHNNRINSAWNLDFKGPGQLFGDLSRLTSPGHSKDCSPMPPKRVNTIFYRDVCNRDDPPRSIAVCSQHRCVAFGNMASVQLHWIDALTGNNLTSSFPLSVPSEYLYFCAPRNDVDSAKKLRLISSAAHPNDRPRLSHKFRLAEAADEQHRKRDEEIASIDPDHPSLHPYRGLLESTEWRPTSDFNADRYHAISLSDGYHALFVDPQSGRLFLGCDELRDGSTNLVRKVEFLPPSLADSTPRLYTAAFEMDQGIRIIAVFGNKVVLYSVPSDVYNALCAEERGSKWELYTTPSFCGGRLEDHWLRWWYNPPSSYDIGRTFWPISLRGSIIGVQDNLCEVIVQTKPDITIWGFSSDFLCKTWRLCNYVDRVVQSQHYVCSNGIVHDAPKVDQAQEDGLIDKDCTLLLMESDLDFMTVLDSSPNADMHDTEQANSFDGHSSQVPDFEQQSSNSQSMMQRHPRILSLERNEELWGISTKGYDAWYEENGDVIMVPLHDEHTAVATLADGQVLGW